MKRVVFLVAATAFAFQPAQAWDGFDYESGSHVEIERGNLVRPGETIEIYDYEAGEYRDVEVESIDRFGRSVEVEVYDSESGGSRTLEMDD
jgi:hypothetical protein